MKDPEFLHINHGSRTLNIRSYIGINKKPVSKIECIEDWDNDGDFYEDSDDNQWATFYLNVEDIDKIIEKLKEVKEFLNSNTKN